MKIIPPKLNVGIKFRWIAGVFSMILSWSVNHSIIWALIHFFIYLIYIPYWLLHHSDVPKMILEFLTEATQ